jgi:hypothetical protein
MKSKQVISAVIFGYLAGFALTFFVAFTSFSPWRLVNVLCGCCWVVLAFPLGWLGLIAGRFSATTSVSFVCFFGAIALNACVWGWAALGMLRAVQQRASYKGLDVSTISSRIVRLRENHPAMAHSRARPLHSRKGLLAAAGRAVRRLAFFVGEEDRLKKWETK